MERDGYTKSLWQTTTPEEAPGPAALPVQTLDAVVVGAGITGMSTGMALALAGKSCLVLEAHTVGFGTTGGTTAHINTSFDLSYDRMISKIGKDDALLVAQAGKEAAERIRRWAARYAPQANWRPQEAYLLANGKEQAEELDALLKGALEVGLDADYTTDVPGYFNPTKAVRIGGQASFHPGRYLMGLVAAFRAAGGLLVEHCRMLEVEPKDELLEVRTERGTVRTRNLVYATHVPPGVNILHFRNAPYRSYVLAAKLKPGSPPLGALVYDMEDPYHYYREEEVDGQRYLIAGGQDHKTAEGNEPKHVRALEAHVRSLFPVEEVTHQWSSQWFEATDGLPYIGHLPMADERIRVATGYGGNGMTFGTVASIVLADLIAKGTSPYQEVFRPGRVSLVAGFANFVKEAADVVGQLVSAPFPKEKLKELGDLANGEGRVVQFDGRQVGLYRDADGRLHAVSPACSHIKCSVAWNGTERSWDCPCHGSRFAVDGSVLTAPARKPLQPVELKNGESRIGSGRP